MASVPSIMGAAEAPFRVLIRIPDAVRYLLHVRHPEAGFKDHRDISELVRGYLSIGDFPAIREMPDTADLGYRGWKSKI